MHLILKTIYFPLLLGLWLETGWTIERHQVKRGETLTSISHKYGTSIAEIKWRNKLESDRIKAGDYLIISGLTENQKMGEKLRGLHNMEKGRSTWQKHRIRKGETLTHISKHYGISIASLKRANHLKDDRIVWGKTLKIPLPLIIPKQTGDDFSEIAYRAAVAEIEGKINSFLPAFRTPLLDTVQIVREERKESLFRKIVELAKSLLGIRYRRGGTNKNGFDCSGFVQHVYGTFSFPLPRSATEQFKVGFPISKEELLEGDLLFFQTRKRPFPSHVGIYIGDNQFIHASSGKRRVTITDLDDPYYKKRFVGARRI